MSTTAPATPDAGLPGVNVLLMGPAGTGKTHSLGTLVEAGIEVFYLGLESGLEALKGYFTDKGKPIPPNLHWHILKAPSTDFLDMQDRAKKINQFSFEALTKMVDPNRQKHNQWIELFSVLNNFEDQRTGEKFGSVQTWDTTRALAIDGMTGLGKASMAGIVGNKPVRSQTDWGMAQQEIESLLGKLCDGCKCHFILLAHVERETDMVLGGTKLMVSTLGQKLAPKIPAMFSDIILTVRQNANWTWDTANPMADLKTRNLSYKSDNEPSFGPIIAKWKARSEAA